MTIRNLLTRTPQIDDTSDLDALADRFGFPRPISAEALVPMQIDLSEPATPYVRTRCCCNFHGFLHNPLDCCPVHKRERAGVDVPAMLPIAEADLLDQEGC